MILTYKYKAYRLNDNRNRKLDKVLSISCWVYNHCIALHKRYYRLYGKHLHKFRIQKHLTKLKKQEKYKNWNELSSHSIQIITEKIHEGYQKFFRKENKRPPTFRSRKKYKSITFKNTGWSINENELIINKQKLKLKYFSSRPLNGNIATITIKKDTLRDVYICFSLKNISTQKIIKSTTSKIAGFDFGLKTFLTSSEEEKYNYPEFLKKSIKELKKKSKDLSKKQKGSNSRKKAISELARFYRRITNQRNDYQWKLAHELTDKYDVLCFENLNIKAMKRLWGRKINDYSFSYFLIKINQIASKKNKKIVQIDRFYPSSKMCNCCSNINQYLSLKDRFWTCEKCNTCHDRDVNAAKNIKKVGASTLKGELVRPALVG